jgi:hypothetical protein
MISPEKAEAVVFFPRPTRRKTGEIDRLPPEIEMQMPPARLVLIGVATNRPPEKHPAVGTSVVRRAINTSKSSGYRYLRVRKAVSVSCILSVGVVLVALFFLT